MKVTLTFAPQPTKNHTWEVPMYYSLEYEPQTKLGCSHYGTFSLQTRRKPPPIPRKSLVPFLLAPGSEISSSSCIDHSQLLSPIISRRTILPGSISDDVSHFIDELEDPDVSDILVICSRGVVFIPRCFFLGQSSFFILYGRGSVFHYCQIVKYG